MPVPILYPGDAGYTPDQVAAIDALAASFAPWRKTDQFLGVAHPEALPDAWNQPLPYADSSGDQIAIYTQWLAQMQAMPQCDFCRMFGFNVDVAASISLGYGGAFGRPDGRGFCYGVSLVSWHTDAGFSYSHGVLSKPGLPKPGAPRPEWPGLTLGMLYTMMNDYFRWGPAWMADQIRSFWSAPGTLSQLREDLIAGRLQLKYLFPTNAVGADWDTQAAFHEPDHTTIVENRATRGLWSTNICATDHSLAILTGRTPDRSGQIAVSPQTLAVLICSGMIGSNESDYSSQLEEIKPVFTQAQVNKWSAINTEFQKVWSQQNGIFAQLDAALSSFRGILNQYVSVVGEAEQAAALFTSLAIRFTVLFSTLAVSLVAPAIGIPAAALIVTGLSVAAQAATGQSINAGSVVLGTAGSIAAVAGVNTGAVATISTAATAIQTGGSQVVDIGGINVDVGSSALAPLAAAAQSVAPDIGSPLANILPASTAADLSQALGSVNVSPASGTPNVVAANPVATAKPGVVTNSLAAKLAAVKPSAWAAIAAAAYYVLR